jgi:hypothetical protein
MLFCCHLVITSEKAARCTGEKWAAPRTHRIRLPRSLSHFVPDLQIKTVKSNFLNCCRTVPISFCAPPADTHLSACKNCGHRGAFHLMQGLQCAWILLKQFKENIKKSLCCVKQWLMWLSAECFPENFQPLALIYHPHLSQTFKKIKQWYKLINAYAYKVFGIKIPLPKKARLAHQPYLAEFKI